MPLVLITGCNNEDSQKPSEDAVFEAVKAYKSTDSDCQGAYALEEIKIDSVKEYVKQFGAWKVSYEYISKCKEGIVTVTNNQIGKPVDVFVRDAGNGKYEAFLPDIFK